MGAVAWDAQPSHEIAAREAKKRIRVDCLDERTDRAGSETGRQFRGDVPTVDVVQCVAADNAVESWRIESIQFGRDGRNSPLKVDGANEFRTAFNGRRADIQ